jgi:hypothetical protein
MSQGGIEEVQHSGIGGICLGDRLRLAAAVIGKAGPKDIIAGRLGFADPAWLAVSRKVFFGVFGFGAPED